MLIGVVQVVCRGPLGTREWRPAAGIRGGKCAGHLRQHPIECIGRGPHYLRDNPMWVSTSSNGVANTCPSYCEELRGTDEA